MAAADQGAKSLAQMRRSRLRRRAGEARSEELRADALDRLAKKLRDGRWSLGWGAFEDRVIKFGGSRDQTRALDDGCWDGGVRSYLETVIEPIGRWERPEVEHTMWRWSEDSERVSGWPRSSREGRQGSGEDGERKARSERRRDGGTELAPCGRKDSDGRRQSGKVM